MNELWLVPFAKHYPGGEIKKNEMGGVCGTYGRQESYVQGFGGET
jgi:hypothetical protein